MTQLRIYDTLRFVVLYLQCLMVGVFFGYQALLPILLNEHIFFSFCSETSDPSIGCPKQLKILNLMFSLSISALTMSCLLWSSLPLKYGPNPNIIIGGSLLTISYITFSFGNDWLCFISYIFMAIGCAAMIFGIILVPAQYGKIQGFLYSLFVGFSDASSGITYIFLLIYSDYDVSLQTLFIALGITSGIISFITYLFIYSSIFDASNQSEKSEQTKQDENTPADYGRVNTVDIGKDETDESAKDETHTEIEWKKIFTSVPFIAITLWSMIYILSIYFYLMTLFVHLSWVTNNNESKIYFAIQIFSIMLFLSGLWSVITGPILDRLNMSFIVFLFGIISLIASVCSCIKVYELQWFTMILFVYLRFFFFATVPLLIIKAFGIDAQRVIYGIVLFISGVFNFIAPLLANFAINKPYPNFIIIHLIIGLLCFISSSFAACTLKTKINKVNVV